MVDIMKNKAKKNGLRIRSRDFYTQGDGELKYVTTWFSQAAATLQIALQIQRVADALENIAKRSVPK